MKELKKKYSGCVKALVLSIVFLSIMNEAKAQGQGNGGTVFVCRGVNGIEYEQTQDLWTARKRSWKLRELTGSPEEIARVAILKLKERNPFYYQKVSLALEKVIKIKNITRMITKDANTSMTIEIMPCPVHTNNASGDIPSQPLAIAYYTDRGLGGEFDTLDISKELWDAFGFSDYYHDDSLKYEESTPRMNASYERAAVLVHEAVFKVARGVGQSDSRETQEAVAEIFAKEESYPAHLIQIPGSFCNHLNEQGCEVKVDVQARNSYLAFGLWGNVLVRIFPLGMDGGVITNTNGDLRLSADVDDFGVRGEAKFLFRPWAEACFFKTTIIVTKVGPSITTLYLTPESPSLSPSTFNFDVRWPSEDIKIDPARF